MLGLSSDSGGKEQFTQVIVSSRAKAQILTVKVVKLRHKVLGKWWYVLLKRSSGLN